ncbi:MAG TPA: hypothetical protein VFN91_00695 [Myxococcaceae bacterium]|nr:hypothetical protein [Myxococcaceae bacterium]
MPESSMAKLTRELPLFTCVLAALVAVVAYGTGRRLTAPAARPSPATVQAVRGLADDHGKMSMHIADGDADVGPGNAESVLATHPTH